MKLFTIKSVDNKATDLYFENKKAAKAKRDELNGGSPKELAAESKFQKYKVTQGPDHRWA